MPFDGIYVPADSPLARLLEADRKLTARRPDAPRWRQLNNGAFIDAEDLRKALRVLDDAER
jgi:hypothetical protein